MLIYIKKTKLTGLILESALKGHIHGVLSLIFPNLYHLELYTLPELQVFLEILVENKTFRFSKRALLLTGTVSG